MDAATRAKLSEAAKAQTNRSKPPSHLGVKRSEETKQRQSIAIRRHYYNKRLVKLEQLMPTCWI